MNLQQLLVLDQLICILFVDNSDNSSFEIESRDFNLLLMEQQIMGHGCCVTHGTCCLVCVSTSLAAACLEITVLEDNKMVCLVQSPHLAWKA